MCVLSMSWWWFVVDGLVGWREYSDCMAVIASKDGIIREFHGQMKEKDDAYVKLLKKQQEDIATLIVRLCFCYD